MSTTLLDAALSPAPLLVVKVSLLLGAAGCVAALLRRRTSAATRHLVWNLALIGALAIPIASIALPGWTFAIGLAPERRRPGHRSQKRVRGHPEHAGLCHRQ